MENNNQAQIPPRKSFNLYDFFSGLGDIINVGGSVLGLTVRWAGPIMAVAGALTTNVSNYLTNKAKRDQNAPLKARLINLATANPNIHINPTELEGFRNCYGLKAAGLSALLNLLIDIPALTGSALAFYYNIEKEKMDQNPQKAATEQDPQMILMEQYLQVILITATALSLVTPIVEKISQHYKQDNLDRQRILYQNRNTLFRQALANLPPADINDAPENQNLPVPHIQ